MRVTSWWWVASLAIVGCGQESAEAASDSGSEPATAQASAKDAEAAPGPAEAEAPKEPEPPTPAGHAVVRVGGAFYASATSATPVVVPELGTQDTAAPGVTIDIVGEENGRLVVETLGGAAGQHHCAGELSGLSDLRLRLYVDPKDLMSITTAPVEHAFADGTKIALSAGVPLAETGASDPLVQRANAGGVHVDVPVPEESRGTFHEPGEARSAEGALGKIHDGGDPPPPLRYGDGGTLSESKLYRDGFELAHYGVTSRDGDALLTVRSACLEAIVRTSTARLSPPPAVPTAGILGALGAAGSEEDVWGGLTGTEIGEAYGVGGLGLVGTGRAAAEATYTARVGAPIHWEDGTVAGQVLSARDFDGPSREVDGRRCFDVKIVAGKDAALPLCFAGADIEEKPAEAKGTIGLGSYGLIGRGHGYSGGSGGGIGLGAKRVPAVRHSKAGVKGSLDKDIIRRIVRAHINEVRYCYNQALVKDPKAEGEVTVDFTIAADGKVSASTSVTNTTGDKNLGKCIAKAVKRWTFPKPKGGGIVNVTYPFVLQPSE